MSTPTTKYHSKERIAEIFAPLAEGNFDAFFAHVIPDVDWQVQSQSTLGGKYTSLADFREQTFGRMGKVIDPNFPVRPKVHNIVGGGDEEWAFVEMTNTSKTKIGLQYNNTFGWATRWSPGPDGKIVQVRAYLDTGLIDRVIPATEKALAEKSRA